MSLTRDTVPGYAFMPDGKEARSRMAARSTASTSRPAPTPIPFRAKSRSTSAPRLEPTRFRRACARS